MNKLPLCRRWSVIGTIGLALAAAGCSSADLKLPDMGLAPATGQSQDAANSNTAGGDQPANVIAAADQMRQTGRKKQALRKIEKAASRTPGNLALLKQRALLALEVGQVRKAEALLKKAIAKDAKDWRLHSALGATLASQGRQPEAQQAFANALELTPDNPAVLNNLALSYALSGKKDHAEALLRKAMKTGGTPEHKDRARQNLALLLGLRGRIAEAQKVSRASLPPETSDANMKIIKMTRAEPVYKKSASAGGVLPSPTYRLGGPKAVPTQN